MNPTNCHCEQCHCELFFLLDPSEAISEGFCGGLPTPRILEPSTPCFLTQIWWGKCRGEPIRLSQNPFLSLRATAGSVANSLFARKIMRLLRDFVPRNDIMRQPAMARLGWGRLYRERRRKVYREF